MANKRTLKRDIRNVCSRLFAECVATSLYATKRSEDDMEAMLRAIVKLESHYINRVSHPEPGMKQKVYFKDLVDKFNKQMVEIVDQINFSH